MTTTKSDVLNFSKNPQTIQIINSYKVPGAHKSTRDVSSDKDLGPSAWPVIATSVFMGFCIGLYEPTDYLGIIYVASLIWITFIHTVLCCSKET